jgi:hypothetical protein
MYVARAPRDCLDAVPAAAFALTQLVSSTLYVCGDYLVLSRVQQIPLSPILMVPMTYLLHASTALHTISGNLVCFALRSECRGCTLFWQLQGQVICFTF